MFYIFAQIMQEGGYCPKVPGAGMGGPSTSFACGAKLNKEFINLCTELGQQVDLCLCLAST